MEYEILQNLKDICKQLEEITKNVIEINKKTQKLSEFYFDEVKGICSKEKTNE